jgi:hypothetical protein
MLVRFPALTAVLSITAFGALLQGSESVRAGEMECFSIQNRDRQHYCLAIARGNVMDCYSIQNRDFQHICIAQVQGNKMECYAIQDRDAQNQCLAMF